MKNVKTYNEFVNEELNFKKALAGAALGAGLLMGSPLSASDQPLKSNIPTEQTISEKEIVETRIAVSNLIKCDYKYTGYDLNSDGSTTIYFNKKNNTVILNCESNKKWNGKDNYIKFIIKNSILK